jgi:signal transduction histidine kinase
VKRPLSIQVYLGLSHALLIVFALGAIGYIWSRNEYLVITNELMRLTSERAVLLSNFIKHEIEEHDQLQISQEEYLEAKLDEGMLAVFIDNAGTLNDLTPGSISPRQVEQFLQLSSEYPITSQRYASLVRSGLEATNIYVAAPVVNSENQVIGKVCILMPIGNLDSYILRLRWLLIGATLVVMLLGLGTSVLLTNYFSRQFSRAQDLAARVTDGNYNLRIPETGPAELRELSHYLNVMAEKLQEQLKTRQTLLANVAHEIARPLAGLQLAVESLRKGAVQDPELADDLLVNMGQTIHQLHGLIDDITLAAQPVNRPIELNRTVLAVEPFLIGIMTRFWTIAESRRIRFDVQVDADVPPVWADEKRLNQIVGNLVDNAIKFTPRSKVIRLSASRADAAHVRIEVHDGGKGIQPDEAAHLFEPFYQGRMGRHLKQGMGLGLAISQQLAQAQGGSLTLENHPAGGASAVLILPAAGA